MAKEPCCESGHQHVMAPDGSWYQCQFCDFGLFDFEMPDAPDRDFWADWEATTGRKRGDHRSAQKVAHEPGPDISGWAEKFADRPLADWQRAFLDGSIRWRDPILPNRRGKQAAYEEAVRTMEETIGPSHPLVSRDGRVYGRFWDESFTARWDR